MRNLITDIAGIKVGHAADAHYRTGVSVIVPDVPAICAVSSMGGGPGTRESDALKPENLVQHIDALVLAGGSVYGLEAASELTLLMGKAGRGFKTGATLPSPIIPAAILFDMNNGGDKTGAVPYRGLARAAYDNLGTDFALGNIGAGYGAQAGTRKGGLGSASASANDDTLTISALVAVNALGSACDDSGNYYASYLLGKEDGVPITPPDNIAKHIATDALYGSKFSFSGLGNTSIGVVATDADLTRAEATRIALMAQDGLARSLRPVHTPFDGDTLYVLATGQKPLAKKEKDRALALTRLGAMAADCVARAVMRGVHFATPL